MKEINFAHFYTGLVLAILLLHTFYPKFVNVDRFTVTFFVILFFMLILPTLVSGRVSYLFEFKRDLNRLNDSVKKLKERDGAKNPETKEKVEQEVKNGVRPKNVCYTTGKIIETIGDLLKRIITKKFADEDIKKHKDSSTMIKFLKDNKVISSELAEAIIRTVKVCTPVGYHKQLSLEDVEEIIDNAIPVIQKLTELAS